MPSPAPASTSPLAAVRFRGVWRPYQARVLEALAAHLDDGRVHLIAPPGSGKTLLGLEMVVRLGRPALVLAPTLALRDQWLSRFADLFEGEVSTSVDPEAPAGLTVATYQGLHAAAQNRGEELVGALRDARVGTLVVDEAHHLRNAWWQTLHTVRAELGDVQTVALTATPPYDVPTAEWKRYESFCGLPDADISIPELVRAGHLCPHRDLVRYALPAPDEQARLDAVRRDTQAVIEDVTGGPWLDALRAHPWMADPGAHADAIADHGPEWFVAALAVLAETTGTDVTAHAAILDLGTVPPLRLSLLDSFLTGIIGPQADRFEPLLPEHAIRDLRRRLDRLGVLDGSRVVLQHPASVRSALAASASKLALAAEAVQVESEARGEGLRAVVLADRIREAAWTPGRGAAVLDTLGVGPLFERLRTSETGHPLAVLTGRVVIVPERATPALRAACERSGVAMPDAEPLAVAPGYVRLDGSGGALVGPVTALFEAGAVRVLVGTVALLGEGWDAPSANVLVSASATATFVQTGQVRGRVFRTDPGQPGKVSSVWHLAVPDPADPSDSVEPLRRRFRAFVCPRPGTPPTLETGLPPVPAATPDAIRQSNEASDRQARDHGATRDIWRLAVGEGVRGGALRPVVRMRRVALAAGVRVPSVAWWRPSLPAGGLAGAGLVTGLTGVLMGAGQVAGASMGVLGVALVAWGGGAFVRQTVRRRRRHAALGPEGLAAQAAARAVLGALRQSGAVTDSQAVVRVERSGDGTELWLDTARDADAEAFTDALADLFGAVRSPRYLLRVEGGAAVPVPATLGSHKRRAQALLDAWGLEVGPASLVFTRTPSGRRALASAQAQSLRQERAVERVRRWSTPPDG